MKTINGDTMFILDKSKFGDCDLTNAKEFVEFWNKESKEDNTKVFNETDKIISYINELNLNNDLTEENVKRLLRWKDHYMLTEKIRSGPNAGNDNDRVMRVLKELKSLNDFRHGRIPETDFLKKVKDIYPNGFVWQVFLFHIARPKEYPIADQNVFRVFHILTKEKTPEYWDGYNSYKEFFFEIAAKAGIRQENENNFSIYVSRLKEVDNALFAYGIFLESYYSKK